MILLDTNVLSALMQREPEPAVVAWLDAQGAESVWISSVTLFEARYGIALLPEGQRRTRLEHELDQLVQAEFGQRVLVFDAQAARQAALLAARRKAQGRNVDVRDTWIAGVALAHGATLATRNTRHFDDLTTPVVNPWQRS
ncbi:MAG: type II toxin-antitoxin system VapC family toxin [Rubrivivax sp.]